MCFGVVWINKLRKLDHKNVRPDDTVVVIYLGKGGTAINFG